MGTMDRPPNPPDTGLDARPAENPALRSTMVSDGTHLCATVDSRVRFVDPDAPAVRDLVADVIYYQSNRELFGVAIDPPRLGKYILERLLGSGAFGAVILGRNPDTEGEVAIKILHTDDRLRGEREALRLHREAQALAQLAHPNIIPDYDAGVADGARYVVMRRVSGTTLRQAQQGKDWRAVVDLYVAAARGLAAVHAAGLVHRDFKADNVLVGADGQVMLADFGLVCLADDPGERHADAAPPRDTNALAARLTRTGEVFGTPAYMAPEVIENAPVGPLSDLFSLAASLFEGLYGVLPFEGDTLFSLYLSATQNKLRAPPDGTAVPSWLDAIVRGALRPDPRQRPSSVDAWIIALDFRARERAEVDERARKLRRKRFTVGLGLAAAVGLGLGAATMKPVDPCAAPETKIASAWPGRRAGIEDAVVALDDAASAKVWAKIGGLLDDWSADWTTTFGDTCRATFHDGAQSEELFDARVACLDQRRRELVALVGHLEPVSAVTLVDTLDAAARLDRPAACATATRTPSPTPDQRRALLPIQDALAEARVLELVGDYAGADRTSDSAIGDARAVDFTPVLAEALIASGRAKWLVHAGDAARTALTEALDLAEANALDDLAADASNLLTKVAAVELRDGVRGDEWARQSQRKLARIAADPWRRAELLNNRGLLAFHVAGDPDGAVDLHLQALALRQSLPGEARLLVAASHQNLGNALAARGELDAAMFHYGESRRLDREVLGDSHPRIFDDVYNRAVTFYETGDYLRAAALAEEALNGYQRSADPVSADVADAHLLLATIAEQQRQLKVGLAHARLAASLLAEDLAASPGKRAIAVERVGTLERELGDPDVALRSYARALELLGDDPNFTAERVSILTNRANTLTSIERWSEAHRDCDRALGLARDDIPALARYRAAALRAKGRAFLLARRPDRARPLLEQALSLLENNQDPPVLAEVKFLLARTLTEDNGVSTRALTLAHESLAFFQITNHAEFVQDILTWIDANQPRATQ